MSVTIPFQGDENAYPPHINQFKKQINRTLFCCFALLALQSNAATIHYQATDLTDTTMGEDLWRYSYSVSDHVFSMDTGFSIYFDPALYSDLQDPAPVVNADWDILINQPLPLFFDEGIYDALALVDTPSLINSFNLTFVWLGLNAPGTQAYEVVDASFNVIAAGNTLLNQTNAVSTPHTLWLLILGLFGLIRKQPINRTHFLQGNQS